ncbi:hypothetical protein C9374_002563 [Naegleria lovaniensis]|uniref:Smr domain-containing protein n=1 Tax=Naegleria lovaniensis TaxID=51637 RepID=A0AA88GSB4_NAELO|nr:uncharacterized protein C9374_002563 [Naegleria lovaniensis]KAG2386117.1 hypothetical protein C9374_002563 [Naegleria lovaniensis]
MTQSLSSPLKKKILSASSSSTITMRESLSIEENSRGVVIGGEKEQHVQLAWKLIEETLRDFGWRFDRQRQVFYEIQSEAQKLFADLEKNIEKEASLMSECFSKSQKAFKHDKKAEAKVLSEEGKKHQELMQKFQKQSSEEMLKFVNKNNSLDVLDLHCQYSQFALDIVIQRMSELKKKGFKQLTIIHGAGSHSDKRGPKIKPIITNYLKNNRVDFEEVNSGQILVTLCQ